MSLLHRDAGCLLPGWMPTVSGVSLSASRFLEAQTLRSWEGSQATLPLATWALWRWAKGFITESFSPPWDVAYVHRPN